MANKQINGRPFAGPSQASPSDVVTAGAAARNSLLGVSCALSLALALGHSGVAQAQNTADNLGDEALAAQTTQAELQARIDQADDEVRQRIEALRQAEQEAQRLQSYNQALAPQLEQLKATLEQRSQGMATMAETRDALPGLLNDMTRRLDAWVDQDVPFLHGERKARVASLEASLANPELTTAEKLERVLAAWRAELDYGRDLDAWRGTLEEGDQTREVDFLRLGRVGWYYLTPDGQNGGVWDDGGWQSLSAAERDQVEKGLQIVRDQRAPELLTLPLTQPIEERS
tara:strand:- start:1949 stop:2809 length:861 start_codon:yes stop_codon:yes gene_type:complete